MREHLLLSYIPFEDEIDIYVDTFENINDDGISANMLIELSQTQKINVKLNPDATVKLINILQNSLVQSVEYSTVKLNDSRFLTMCLKMKSDDKLKTVNIYQTNEENIYIFEVFDTADVSYNYKMKYFFKPDEDFYLPILGKDFKCNYIPKSDII